VDSSRELCEALISPIIAPEKKCAILEELFADKVHEIALSYLKLLVEKRREEAIRETEQEYVLLANEARGIVQAEATTAVALDEVQQAQLASRLSEVTGKQVELVCKIDPSVIGGVLVRIGDRVIDGSVRGQLEALRERLLS
jgi:F-type H+-transporting ATPase subunit delta